MPLVRIRFRTHWPLAAAVLITCYGALLRLDAFTQKYGTFDHPAWARVMTHDVAPIARHLRPSGIGFGVERNPYVGGDPISYLRSSRRDMTSFYQPHVREPVFLAATRVSLWALDGPGRRRQPGVRGGIAAGDLRHLSARRSRRVAPAADLAAAALMAIEYENITWAVDGWRDDTFTGTCRARRVGARAAPAIARHFANALLAGFACGAACLTGSPRCRSCSRHWSMSRWRRVAHGASASSARRSRRSC